MGDSNIRYADIIIDISHEALDKVFQYRVPLSLWEEVQPGSRVFVPFGRGNRETEGYSFFPFEPFPPSHGSS